MSCLVLFCSCVLDPFGVAITSLGVVGGGWGGEGEGVKGLGRVGWKRGEG